MGSSWKGLVLLGKRAMSENKPAIFFATGVVCLASCVVLTARSAPRFEEKVNQIDREVRKSLPEVETEEEAEERAKALKKQKAIRILKEAVPMYAPSAMAGIASVVAFGLSNRQLSKQAAGAVAACTIAEKALGAYQDNVISELGEEVHDKIMQAIVDDVPSDILEADDAEIEDRSANLFKRDLNDKLYYDHVTGRVFWSTDEKIKDAESTVNKLLIDTGVATVNDFYSSLLLDCDSVVGDAIGWRIDDAHARNMDVVFGSRLDRDNNPLITIGYRTCAVNLRELERR